MSYLFIKDSFKEKNLYYFNKKFKIEKKQKKTVFVGFGLFRWVFWVFLGGFFWVGFFVWVFYWQPA
jgi:hypothetical protein